MPDISMCMDNECPSKAHCYRFRARPNEWQSYCGFKHKGEKCERYISTSGFEEKHLVPVDDVKWSREHGEVKK